MRAITLLPNPVKVVGVRLVLSVSPTRETPQLHFLETTIPLFTYLTHILKKLSIAKYSLAMKTNNVMQFVCQSTC